MQYKCNTNVIQGNLKNGRQDNRYKGKIVVQHCSTSDI